MANSRVPSSLVVRRRRTFGAGTIAVTAALLACPTSALPQTSTLGNDSNYPNVTVDLSVINDLGPRRNVPQLLIPTLPRNVRPSQVTSPALRSRPPLPYAPRPPVMPPGGQTFAAERDAAALRAQARAQERIVLKPPPGVGAASRPPGTGSAAPKLTAPSSKKPAPAPSRSTAAAPLRATPPPPPPMIAEAPKAPAAPPKRSSTSGQMAAMSKEETRTIRPAPPPPPKVAAPKAPEPPKIKAPEPPPPPAAAMEKPVAPPAAPTTASRAPEPPAPPKPMADDTEKRMAALTPPSAPANGGTPSNTRRIAFSEGNARLNDAAIKEIDAIAATLKKDESLRLQLFAYARGGAGSSNNPRRLSLSRALAVRSELIDKGVVGRRIEVRAEGDRVKDGPPDRVDMILSVR